MKCYYRVIARETPAYKGKPICVNPNKSDMRCIKESEYSIRISADISQELPVGGVPGENMGAPVPTMQRVNEAVVSLNAEMEEFSNALGKGRTAIRSLAESTRRW
jgi:hypothetical protein